MQVGIIGLPNVGKSTIFNDITKANAEVANYPFCTIEPNTGVISVVDDYLEQLSEICGSKKMTYASIQFMDVAGLVKGASKGEGLGNKFLSHIRAADIVAHVVRCFTDTNIASESPPDPVGDIATVNTELLLSDLEVLNRQKEKLKSLARTGDKESGKLLEFTKDLIAKLNREERPDISNLGQSQSSFLNQLDLLSLKPVLFIANMDDSQESKKLYRELAEQVGEQNTVQFYARLEQELADIKASERKQYIQELGIEGGPRPLVASCYNLLDLITFYTLNKNEARAWSLNRGKKVTEAAAKVHSDMEKGFIKAEVIGADQLLEAGSFSAARETGRLRIEGRDYIVSDRDVIQIRFSV